MRLIITLGLLISVYAQEANYSELGKKALKPLKMGLMKELKQGIKNHGVSGAIGTCQLKAPVVTEEVSTPSYTVGRSSSKYRNPKNKPQAWMEEVLKSYETTASKASQVIRLKTGETAYVEPIYLKGLCLNCHGAKLSKSVESELAKLYSNDKAKGYKVNDFRGIFWVKFK